MSSILRLFAVLISSIIILAQTDARVHYPRLSGTGYQQYWSPGSHNHRLEIFKKWVGNSQTIGTADANSPSTTSSDVLNSSNKFKGCIDPSEPFQCPRSEQCIALQFICDGHPGDCPDNVDENEETCIAAKRPAKENIEKFLQAQYMLYGKKLFAFLFGEKIAKSIEENYIFWVDALASAFSVSKTIRNFAEKTYMSPQDLAHFRNVIQIIHDGRLEEIPMYAQEAVNQGLASLVEKLYDSGFMDN